MVCLCILHDQRTQEGDLKFSIECDGVLMYLVLVHASPVVQSYNRLVVSLPSFLPSFPSFLSGVLRRSRARVGVLREGRALRRWVVDCCTRCRVVCAPCVCRHFHMAALVEPTVPSDTPSGSGDTREPLAGRYERTEAWVNKMRSVLCPAEMVDAAGKFDQIYFKPRNAEHLVWGKSAKLLCLCLRCQ